MAKEICISTTPHETRLAILEDDQLAEIYYERENEYTLAGSIYKGRVTRVLPGMQSSFVDVGLERDAFLYVTDFLEEQEDSDEYASDGNGGGGRREARPQAESLGTSPKAGQLVPSATRIGTANAAAEGNEVTTAMRIVAVVAPLPLRHNKPSLHGRAVVRVANARASKPWLRCGRPPRLRRIWMKKEMTRVRRAPVAGGAGVAAGAACAEACPGLNPR